MGFPIHRLRRLREHPGLREMVAETRLSAQDLVMPLFVREGHGERRPIASMPGQCQWSVDTLVERAGEAAAAGVPAVLLFGIPSHKDAAATSGTAPDGIIPRAVRALKEAMPNLVVMTDVCLCEYTDHGHCGVLTDRGGETVVDNDRTLSVLGAMAVAHAQAGADVVAPSDMMDGRVAAIRRALDAEALSHVPIMSYAAKYASSFYGPFRDAAESPPKFGDRRGYQMDVRNGDEALREVALDVEEGADIVMVKPAGSYLDILWRVKQAFRMPVAAYQVSGEYAMIKAASSQGWVNEDQVMIESLTAIRRAGADLIVTYFADRVADIIEG
ncbi:MAG TPA: porphobilinogen synthase [Phycisphaerae bacterium]|nr:porphobilinogen synthase [Phycisphaerae bacterium]HOI53708.1 porphobilinogen synthase [Phycisphaerae bacterium]